VNLKFFKDTSWTLEVILCVWVELNVATLSDQQLPFAMKKLIDGSLSQSRTQMFAEKLKLKLKPDKFFMASHLRTTGCHRSMVSHSLTCSPT